MARIRMIKPEFWDDEKMASISRDARLTFIGILNHSDDYGSVKGNPLWLKNKIFPYDEIKQVDFKKWLSELENIMAIIPYEDGGENYYYIRTFTKHQTINRPSQVRNPAPHESIIECSRSTHGTLTPQIKLNKEEIKLNKREVEVETPKPPKGAFIEIPFFEIIEYLNLKTGKHFDHQSKETRAKIRARWGINGKQRTLEDFKRVIDNKCASWLNDPAMANYLRPETLFGTKFESYLNEQGHELSGVVSDKTIKTVKMLDDWSPPT